MIMTEQRQRRINEAAEKFADALSQSYEEVAGRAVSAQELNTEMMHSFFNEVINNLRTRAEQNAEMTQQLAEQQERQREAAQALRRESIEAHMDFVHSMFSFYQSGLVGADRS
jgi:replication initiation and membrane attachment protein DnaB